MIATFSQKFYDVHTRLFEAKAFTDAVFFALAEENEVNTKMR